MSQRATAGTTSGWPLKWSKYHPTWKKLTGTLQFITTQLSAFYFCVARTTGSPLYECACSRFSVLIFSTAAQGTKELTKPSLDSFFCWSFRRQTAQLINLDYDIQSQKRYTIRMQNFNYYGINGSVTDVVRMSSRLFSSGKNNTLSVDLTGKNNEIFFVLRAVKSFRCARLVDWCVSKKRMAEIRVDTKGAFHLTELIGQSGHLGGTTLQRLQINKPRGWYILFHKNVRDYLASVSSNCCIFFAKWRVWPTSSDKRKAP